MEELDNIITDKKIAAFNTSARSSILALYEALMKKKKKDSKHN